MDLKKRELLRSLLGVGVAGLGVGMGARGVVGLNSLLRTPGSTLPNVGRRVGSGVLGLVGLRGLISEKPPTNTSSSMPTRIAIPVPSRYQQPEEEDELLKAAAAQPLRQLSQQLAREKQADDTPDGSQIPAPDLAGSAANTVPRSWLNSIPGFGNSGSPLKSWVGMPLGFGVGAGGITGGWALMDHVLKGRRAAETDEDIDESKREFRQALADEYEAAMMAKNAECNLDEAFEAWRLGKQAGAGQLARDGIEGLGGAYLTALLATAGVSGATAYNWAKSRSSQNLLRQALARRARQQQQLSPPPVYAVPSGKLSDV